MFCLHKSIKSFAILCLSEIFDALSNLIRALKHKMPFYLRLMFHKGILPITYFSDIDASNEISLGFPSFIKIQHENFCKNATFQSNFKSFLFSNFISFLQAKSFYPIYNTVTNLKYFISNFKFP